MKKSEINPMPQFFDRYINIVEEENLFDAFSKSIQAIDNLDVDLLKKLGDTVYAPGKWTIKDILQHLIDNERVQSYRAMRFARNDKTILPGYDEELFGKNSLANKRNLDDLLDELIQIRQSTVFLFKSFDSSVFQNTGICFNVEISVLALGFNMIGHQIHHIEVIQERYLPLIK